MPNPTDTLQLNLNSRLFTNDLKSHSVLDQPSRDKVDNKTSHRQNQSTSIGGSTRNFNNMTSLDRVLDTGKSSTIHNINGSFLHFDTEKGGKILDLSKKVLKSPRNLIVGEKTAEVVGLNYKVPWNNTSSLSSASKPHLYMAQSPSFIQRPTLSPHNASIQY